MEDGSPTQAEKIMDRLTLDVKALMLLSASDENLRKEFGTRFVQSQDEQISEFLKLISGPHMDKKVGATPKIIIAVGEMVLASILAILGLTLIVPGVLGIGSPKLLSSYFNTISQGFASGHYAQFAGPLFTAFALILLVGGFYALRDAATSVRDAGLYHKPS